ncbi:MAG: ABC transporter substrate-binding protein, partial [Thioalkalispiraceae bacterium]
MQILPSTVVALERLAAELVLHRGNNSEPQSLDPHKSEGVPSANIQRDLYEGLLSEAPGGALVPGVAVKWTISRDGRRYVFTLRKNAKWSNGDPVTADDFVYSWRRIIDPGTGSYYAQTLAPVLNAEEIIRGNKPASELGIHAIDQHHLEVLLKGPTPY